MTLDILWKFRLVAAFVLILGLQTAPVTAQEAAPPAAEGCTPVKGGYACDKGQFQKTLIDAKTATVRGARRDPMERGQLEGLITSLGKTLQTPGQPADLIFIAIPAERSGVDVSPGDRDLGRLLVYAGGVNRQHHGVLVWGEVVKGPSDVPWPSVIQMLIAKLQGDIGKPHATPGV